jgi:microcystin-dependent protein
MAEPFIGEIRLFSFSFAPKGWAFCNGQLLPISQNQALFSLLGTTYGGNGQVTFALPDLQGRMALSSSGQFSPGQKSGEENHTLTIAEIPSHTHSVNASTVAGTASSPGGQFWAVDPNNYPTFASAGGVNMSAAAIANTGGSQPHSNMMPTLVVNFCIAMLGIFPSRN